MEKSHRREALEKKTIKVRTLLGELSEYSNEFLHIIHFYKKADKPSLKGKIYHTLSAKARDVRDAMDARKASNSRLVAPCREICASIGGFGNIGYILKKEILDKLPVYFEENPELNEHLEEKSKSALSFVNQSLMSLCEAVEEEYAKFGLGVSDRRGDISDYIQERPDEFPQDLKAKDTSNEIEKIIALSQRYINITKEIVVPKEGRVENVVQPKIMLNKLILDIQKNKMESGSKLANRIVEQREQIELLRDELALLHSEYDTHIESTKLQRKHKNLKSLIGFIRAQRYLSEIVLEAFHFYERHTNAVKSEIGQRRVSNIITKESILDFVNEFALKSIKDLFVRVEKIAEKTYRNPQYYKSNISTMSGIIEFLYRVDPQEKVTIVNNGIPMNRHMYGIYKAIEEGISKAVGEDKTEQSSIHLHPIRDVVLYGPKRILDPIKDVCGCKVVYEKYKE